MCAIQGDRESKLQNAQCLNCFASFSFLEAVFILPYFITLLMLPFMYKHSLWMYSTAGDTVLHNFTVSKHLSMKNLLCYSHSRRVNQSFNRNRWKKEQIRKDFLINQFYYFRYWKVGDLGSCYSDKVKEKLQRKAVQELSESESHPCQICQTDSIKLFYANPPLLFRKSRKQGLQPCSLQDEKIQ